MFLNQHRAGNGRGQLKMEARNKLYKIGWIRIDFSPPQLPDQKAFFTVLVRLDGSSRKAIRQSLRDIKSADSPDSTSVLFHL
jgi:hypothetical protein